MYLSGSPVRVPLEIVSDQPAWLFGIVCPQEKLPDEGLVEQVVEDDVL
jgi:hypothetical protein